MPKTNHDHRNDPTWPGRVGYGAASMGNLLHPLTDEQAHNVLQAAWDGGVRHFDTAPHYGLGLSERRLGAFLADKPRAEYTISTKVGRLLEPSPETANELDLAHDFHVPATHHRVWDFSEAGVRRSLAESLERLGLDSVDVLYLHDPEGFDLQRGLAEGLPAATKLREEGVVQAIGVGSMDAECLLASAESGAADLLMVAGRFTLADQSTAGELLAACETHTVGIVIASVFNSGLLATDQPSARSNFDYRPADAEILARVQQIAQVCAAHGVSLPTAALHFGFRFPAVRTVVIAGSAPEQVTENVRRLAETVPEALWTDLQAQGLIR